VVTASSPTLTETSSKRRVRRAVKRAFDAVASAYVLILCTPVFVAVAVYIAVLDGRPVFFRQTRVGRHGRTFTMYKFRTMENDAEERRHHLLHHNERRGPLFKVSDDPRVTRSGRFLRRSSLDELPQFLNVLKGDMSIVGPRPALPHEVESFTPELRRRELVPPGITGLWQLDGRADPDFGKYTELDLRYVDHWSLRMDLTIMLRTPAVLISHTRNHALERGVTTSTHPKLDPAPTAEHAPTSPAVRVDQPVCVDERHAARQPA
jgi:lipopolysaccharide/colanic/teichoic acid biosynthesis glycosyltransferase